MPIYTLMLATVVAVNKELPVKSGLSQEQCRVEAMEALKQVNFARCQPVQPDKPFLLLKLPSGVVVEVERHTGGYRLPPAYSAQDHAFVARALGRPSSGLHSKAHGADRPVASPVPASAALVSH